MYIENFPSKLGRLIFIKNKFNKMYNLHLPVRILLKPHICWLVRNSEFILLFSTLVFYIEFNGPLTISFWLLNFARHFTSNTFKFKWIFRETFMLICARRFSVTRNFHQYWCLKAIANQTYFFSNLSQSIDDGEKIVVRIYSFMFYFFIGHKS